MSKPTIRLLAAVLALVGSVILAFAAFSYVQQKRTEDALEAQAPGVSLFNSATTTPIVLLPAEPGSGSAPPIATALSPSVTPFPTQAVPNQPDATAAAQLAQTPTAISLSPRTVSTNGENPTGAPPPATTPGVSGTAAAQVAIAKPAGVPRGSGSEAERLLIPKLNMDLAIKPANYVTFEQNGQLVSDWSVPYDSVGHLSTTAQPGEIGNAVISGHHNLVAPNKFGLGVFAGLWNLTAGDEIRIKTLDGKEQLWRVDESFPIKEGGEPLAVRIQHAEQVMGDTPTPTLTLLTCWNGQANPLSGNTFRWVIHADLVQIN
jgi:hypothetical protein